MSQELKEKKSEWKICWKPFDFLLQKKEKKRSFNQTDTVKKEKDQKKKEKKRNRSDFLFVRASDKNVCEKVDFWDFFFRRLLIEKKIYIR